MNRSKNTIIVLVLVLTAAILPRIFTLGRALTTDEAYHWVAYRSETFFNAIAGGTFAETIITGHPGVTTMWLGSMGLLLERIIQSAGWLTPVSFETHLTLMRLPLACTTALLIGVAFMLLHQLFSMRVALVAALLWASDPFLVAHSRVLHLDALLTMLMLVALLALLSACFDVDGPRHLPHIPALILAGIASGLALLTKSPALLLAPAGTLILLAWFWQRQYPSAHPHPPPPLQNSQPDTMSPLPVLIQSLLLWGGTALFTIVIAWPALWVAPWDAISSVVNEIISNGGAPHKENFLLGTSFDHESPGLLFYPLTLLGRTTPWTALGLVGLAAAVVVSRRSLLDRRRTPLVLIAAIAIVLVSILTMMPKKADRYALPSVPMIHILAAVGLAWAGHTLPTLLRRTTAALIAVAAIVTLLVLHPYYLAYYSPLIGGTTRAPDLVPVGWGEGLDKAADWLAQRPDIATGDVASWSYPSLQAYLPAAEVTWQGAIKHGTINYLVVYINQVQTRAEYQYIGDIHERCLPIHVVRLHNIDYAWIYDLPIVRTLQPAGAQFGSALQLADYTVVPPDACACQPLALELTLKPLDRPDRPLFFFIHITSSDGQTVHQLDIPLADLVPSDYWQSKELLFHPLELPLPEDVPPGEYGLVTGLYDPATDTRLPIRPAPSEEAPADTSEPTSESTAALYLVTFEITEMFRNVCTVE